MWIIFYLSLYCWSVFFNYLCHLHDYNFLLFQLMTLNKKVGSNQRYKILRDSVNDFAAIKRSIFIIIILYIILFIYWEVRINVGVSQFLIKKIYDNVIKCFVVDHKANNNKNPSVHLFIYIKFYRIIWSSWRLDCFFGFNY